MSAWLRIDCDAIGCTRVERVELSEMIQDVSDVTRRLLHEGWVFRPVQRSQKMKCFCPEHAKR